MFKEAKNPRWGDKSHTSIMFDVRLGDEDGYCPFVAREDDCTTHGPLLYNLAAEGVFGEIADSDEERIIRGETPPPEGFQVIDGELVNIADLTQAAEAELSRRLAELSTEEAKARAEIDEEYAVERRAKLAALLAVKEQEGWPLNAEWPED
jgi:hypothetical protein